MKFQSFILLCTAVLLTQARSLDLDSGETDVQINIDQPSSDRNARSSLIQWVNIMKNLRRPHGDEVRNQGKQPAANGPSNDFFVNPQRFGPIKRLPPWFVFDPTTSNNQDSDNQPDVSININQNDAPAQNLPKLSNDFWNTYGPDIIQTLLETNVMLNPAFANAPKSDDGPDVSINIHSDDTVFNELENFGKTVSENVAVKVLTDIAEKYLLDALDDPLPVSSGNGVATPNDPVNPYERIARGVCIGIGFGK